MTALDELEKRLEGPGLIVALTKDEARDLLSAAREGERMREKDWTAFALAFVTKQSEGEWGSDLVSKDAVRLAKAIRAALQSDKPHD